MEIPEVIDFEQFALRRGVDPRGYCEPGFHNPMGFIPRAAQQRHLKMLAAEIAAHAQRLESARQDYEAAVEAGLVRPRTSLERLQDAASGPNDSARAQAARRVLAKRAARPTPPRHEEGR